ncbi:MAG: adenine deaminase [Nitrospirae bacterium]|nr:adenine deaminase [Nitrospirota bacterium]
MSENTFSGNIVDLFDNVIYSGTIEVRNGRIFSITRGGGHYDTTPYNATGTTIIPGLVDAHVHVESSMLVPSEFARLASIHGTVATVSDPHEIANVMGVDGVRYMIENGRSVPFKFYFGAPSCVPATPFETNGASLGPEEVEALLKLKEVKYLSEMMNFPGAIEGEPSVMAKIEAAQSRGKPIDGHAPGLRGANLAKYVSRGITTDHETVDYEEAVEKVKLGMKILIREGSAARNFDTLIPLLKVFPRMVMFCSDDLHPDELVARHIDGMVKKAFALGYDKMDVLRAASVNPVLHYGLDVGLLRPGDSADFVVVDSLDSFNVLKTVVMGEVIAEQGSTLIPHGKWAVVNGFYAALKSPEEFRFPAKKGRLKVILAGDGQLLTGIYHHCPAVTEGNLVSDILADVLKLTVVNRYADAPPAVAFIKGIGLKRGAIAASIAHDSHNILATGVSDEQICRAVNLCIANKGGIAIVDGSNEEVLPLPVAGLMSNDDGFVVAQKYAGMEKMARTLGSPLRAPLMTLSFMALLVIPELKLSDKGLFDCKSFSFTESYEIDYN